MRQLYTLFDRRMREFGPPVVAVNAQTLFRDLQRQISEESIPGKYPEDFDVYLLAEYDETTGRIVGAENVTLVENLKEVLNGAGSGS